MLKMQIKVVEMLTMCTYRAADDKGDGETDEYVEGAEATEEKEVQKQKESTCELNYYFPCLHTLNLKNFTELNFCLLY